MLTRTLALALIALSLCSAAGAKVHRGRPRKAKIFAANHESVRLENEIANSEGIFRYFTQAQVDEDVYTGKLAAMYDHTQYKVSPKLPMERRYALPSTVAFLEAFSMEFYRQFHHPLMVDSAVRPATVQRSLLKCNRNAAPAYGERASTHERGTTLDLSKRLTKAEQQWLVTRLLYYWAISRVLVIQERGCFHIFVRSDQ